MKATRVRHIRDLWGDDGINGGIFFSTFTNTWMARTPNGHVGDLSNHDVVENEDGSITVSPSILVSDNTGELSHGFLINGEWT